MTSSNAFPRTTGIVLAGTHPWTTSIFDRLLPRPLLPVAHRPLIAYALSWFHDAGIRDVAVCGNRESRTVQTWLHDHERQTLTVSYHQDAMPRGAAGSLCDAAADTDATTFVVTDASAIPNVDLSDLLQAHRASGAAATVAVHFEARANGNAPLLVPTGIYVFDRRALDCVRAGGFCDIKENLIPQLYRAGERIETYTAPSSPPRVLDPQSYLAVNEWMIEQLLAGSDQPEGFIRSGHALIHRDASVSDDASCIGPVIVGAGARVMPGAVVIGPASIGSDATIEQDVLVSRSAVWRRSHIGEGTHADHCIITDDSVVEPETEAYGEVLAGSGGAGRNEAEHSSSSQPPAEAASSGELLRKIGRFFSGPHWSRSPAA